jgi:predicted alpha/beta hydrolase
MHAAVTVSDIVIPARDGYPLAATVFAPEDPQAAVLINSAAAVPRRIYRAFADYLAQREFAVLTYDYRGIGGSRPARLKGFRARMRDWASLDVAAVIDHARRTWPHLQLSHIGHSFGGQALGLVPNNADITSALLIASQAGTWRLIQSPERYRVYLMMEVVGQLAAHTFGYLPGKVGLGEDLPKHVFLEWAGWVRNAHYFFDDRTLDELENFPRFRGVMRAIGFSDDPWATAPAIDMLVAGFKGAKAEHIQIAPQDLGVAKIGHFGFFRPDHRNTLWRNAADWLTAA